MKELLHSVQVADYVRTGQDVLQCDSLTGIEIVNLEVRDVERGHDDLAGFGVRVDVDRD